MLKDINVGGASGDPQNLTYVSNHNALYFTAYDWNDGSATASAGYGKGRELWKTDGTESGTIMVKDIWGRVISAPNRAISIILHRLEILSFLLQLMGMVPNFGRPMERRMEQLW